MSFASLDCFYSGVRIPRTRRTPVEGTRLHTYIYRRQIHAHNYAIPRLVQQRNRWGGNGFETSMSEDLAFGALKSWIDAGRPVPILMGDLDSPLSTNSHWVVAIGYETLNRRCAGIHLYDNNTPDRDCLLRPDVSGGCFVHSRSGRRYGFYLPFVDYRVHDARRPVRVPSLAPAVTNPFGMSFPSDII